MNIQIYLAALFTIIACLSVIEGVEMTSSTESVDTTIREYPTEAGVYYDDLDEETIRKIQKCERDLDLMELCMRCAKVTKSIIVYPMCCDNEEDVTKWCYDYVHYGED